MSPAVEQFLTITLPIMMTLAFAMWTNNGRLSELSACITDLQSDINRRFDEVITRLDRIGGKLDSHKERGVRTPRETLSCTENRPALK